MSTSNTGSLADLLGDEKAEETETQSSEVSSTTEDASSSETAEKSDDLLDLLAEEEDETEEQVEEAQEGSKAQKRIQQLVTQRNDERNARQSAEETLTKYADLNNFLAEVYGEDDGGVDAFRTDVAFLKTMLTIANTPGAAQEQVRTLIKTVQDVRDGKLSVNELKKGNNMSTQSSDTPSKGDSAIAREMWSDRIDAVLAHPSIPAEVRTLTNKLAMQEFDPSKVSKTHAQEVVVSILKESGWTPKRSETKAKPPTAAAKRATNTNASTQKADGNSKAEGPKTAREFSALLEEQFNAALLKG